MLYCKEGIWYTQSTQCILLYYTPLGNIEMSSVTEALGEPEPIPGSPTVQLISAQNRSHDSSVVFLTSQSPPDSIS